MISREELAILQKKLVSISKKKEEYEALIAEKETEIEELKTFQTKIDFLTTTIEQEEVAQNRALNEASAEVHNFRPDAAKIWNIFDREDKKVPKLESTIASLEDKLEKLSRVGEELASTNKSNELKITPFIEKLKETQKHIEKYERLSTCVPPAAPIMLQLNDLEGVYSFLKESNKNSLTKIPELFAKAEALEAKNRLSEAQLERTNSELESSLMDLEQQKNAKNEQFANLQAISNELQVVNSEMRNENSNYAKEHSSAEHLDLEQTKELTEIRRQVFDCKNEQESFPDQMKIAHNDNATLLSKKKQLYEQLEKKLADLRQELIQRQANTEEVQQLTSKLEQHWIQHQRIFDQHEKKKALLEKRKDELRRKNIAFEEINTRWPMSGKVKVKIGLSELNYIYEEAMIQNRKMAADLNTLKDDLTVQEEMNATLKSNLEVGE